MTVRLTIAERKGLELLRRVEYLTIDQLVSFGTKSIVIARLEEKKLIVMKGNGCYWLTPAGKAIVE